MKKKEIVVALLLDNGMDSYLTAPRAEDMSYTFPGGKVEEGETLVEAGVRELFEETGLEADPRNLFYIGYTDAKSKLIMFFYCPLWTGRLENKEPKKHGDWRWFALALMPPKRTLGLQDFLTNHRTNFIRLRGVFKRPNVSTRSLLGPVEWKHGAEPRF